MKSSILSVLHITDPTLPIGGYTHSNGLETYVQENLVHDKKTAKEFVAQVLQNSVKFNDAAFVKLAYEATQNKDLLALLALDEECQALKSAREIREASQKLGLRFIKIFKRFENYPLVSAFEKAIQNTETYGHFCIVFGMFSQLLNISIEDALQAFYYNTAIGYITNCVKLVPLGQLDGQDILFELYGTMESLVKETLMLEREYVGFCSVGLDIRCMQHEHLYSRLYMS